MPAVVFTGALSAGLMLGFASVFSVGPCNLMLIREGIKRGHVGLVATTVWLSDLTMLAMGLAMNDTIAASPEHLHQSLAWSGVVIMALFSASAFRSSRRCLDLDDERSLWRETRSACVRRAVMLVWLNPLTYIELMLVPATMLSGFNGRILRAHFLIGLAAMVTLRVYGYSFGARCLAPYLRHARALQLFDVISGAMLAAVSLAVSVRLALG